MRSVRTIGICLAILAATVLARAQAPVSDADITRLETTAADIAKQANTLESADPTLAADVRKSLASLQEDLTYLKVKMRREGSVPRADYGDLRDKLETLRVKAMGKVGADPVIKSDDAKIYTVPVGTIIDVRLQNALNSGTAKPEQRFEGTTIVDFMIDKTVVIPAGSTARGFVSSVRAAGKIDRKGSLTLSFDELRIDNRSQKLRASVEQALDGKMAQDTTRIGVGAVAGAIIGGLLGGGKGALVGVLVGGGGTIASTEGSDVDLPVGTVLRLRVDQPIDVVVGGL